MAAILLTRIDVVAHQAGAEVVGFVNARPRRSAGAGIAGTFHFRRRPAGRWHDGKGSGQVFSIVPAVTPLARTASILARQSLPPAS